MPFTFSHPAIVLPATYLPKKYYSLSALIIGSMTPDFEYFIRMKDYSKYSHTWSGVFWFDLPLGLALLFIFHNVIRNTLIQYLPASLNRRFSVFETFNWNSYFRNNVMIVLISLLAGIVSHLFWDSFTHENRFFSESIPILQEQIRVMKHHTMLGATILQYASSVIGVLIMIIFIFRFPKETYTGQPNILNFWLIVALAMIFVLNARLYLDSILNHHNHEDIIVTLISGCFIGLFTLCVLLNDHDKQRSYKNLQQLNNQ